jgi:hypothetical protein
MVRTDNGDTVSAPGTFEIELTNGMDLSVKQQVQVQGEQVVMAPFPKYD